MKIGVFDSGIGGEAVAEQLRLLLPGSIVTTANDHAHVPYGGRSRAEIMQLTKRAIQPLIDMRCDAIVIACNTATTNAIQLLRHDFPQQKFVGLEPMIKPAAATTKTGKIAVLATPATLASRRYADLKREWAADKTIIEPDCRDWATLIEEGRSHEIDLTSVMTLLLQQGVDTIVLACTHYHWLKGAIQDIVGPDIAVLEPSDAIKNRLVDLVG